MLALTYTAAPAANAQEISNEELKADLVKSIELIPGGLPYMYDEITRLDKLDGSLGEIFYHYTLLGIAYKDLDAKQFQDNMATSLRQNFCNNPDTIVKKFVRKGVNVTHLYNDKDGNLIMSFRIRAADCK